jgi:hypothetical protein
MSQHSSFGRGRRIFLVFALLFWTTLALPGASGCSKREDQLRYCDVPALFQSSCDGSQCHGSADPRADLDLVSPGVDQRLFHVASTSNCDERKLVVPGHPEESVLYLKVSKKDPFCGDRMPIDKELSPDELACLRDYIENAGTDTDGQVCETCGGILCVDFDRDPAHCGGCNQACDQGMVCGAATCVNPCTENEALCGANCVVLNENDEHCGTCGHRCAPGSSCENGACTCDGENEGAGGNGGSSGSGEVPSFASYLLPLFDNSCAGTGCHLGPNSDALPSLAPEVAYENLVDAPAADCSGRDYVVPGSPDQSYLIEKLMGGALCAGDRMPLNNDPLPNTALNSVTRWICAGAPDN